MAKIIGNTTATPSPRPDWNQNDVNAADYIKNKPDITKLATAGPVFTPSVSEDGTLSWTNNGELDNPESVNIKGPQGRSIVSVEKTSSDGLEDTYTIAYSDGEPDTFVVTNGKDADTIYTTEEKTKLAGIEENAQVNIIEGVTLSQTDDNRIYDNGSVYMNGKTLRINSASKAYSGVMIPSQYKKLAGIAEGAQVNVIETVNVNGTALEVADKAVNLDLSAYATQEWVNSQNFGSDIDTSNFALKEEVPVIYTDMEDNTTQTLRVYIDDDGYLHIDTY